jgi:hypothetical protein
VPTLTVTAASLDCDVGVAAQPSWATARAASSGAQVGMVDQTNTNPLLLSYGLIAGGNYYIYRIHIAFDTSAIPDDATVTAAAIGLTFENGETAGAGLVAVATSLAAITQTSDYALANFGSSAAATWGENLSLNTAHEQAADLGVLTINKTGNTCIGVLAGADFTDTAPTTAAHYVLYSADATTAAYRPYISVTYTEAAGGKPYYYRTFVAGV